MKKSLLFFGLFLLTQCHNGGKRELENSNNREEFFEIDYENLLKNKKTINLSDIALEVRYIQLETKKNALISRKPNYFFSRNFIFVNNFDHILVYDYSGKFIRQIGAPGRGPNEIISISTISVIDKEQVIAVQTSGSRKLIFFSFDGKLIKSIPLPGNEFEIHVLNMNKFLLNYRCILGNEDYLYVLSNESWDTISTINNHFKWVNNTDLTGRIGYSVFRPFFNYKDKVRFKSMYNDTVFTVVDDKIEPVYFINLGKYRLPNELRPESPHSVLRFRKGNERQFYYFASVMESGEMIFITTENYSADIDKNIIFYSNTAEGSLLINESKEPSGLINDWDGGAEFWPEGNVSDNEIFMPLSSMTLKNILIKKAFSKATIRFPEKKKALSEMIEKLNETDNPVLMLVKLR
jgi:hypothetical protein